MMTEAADERRSDRSIGSHISSTHRRRVRNFAQSNSRPRNLPPPTLFAMTSQTMAEAGDHSASVGSSVVAIVASESPLFLTVM